MITPTPEKLTDERTDDILNDLEQIVISGDLAKLNDTLKRFTTTSYELYEFVRLNSILKKCPINEDIADTLCIILLRGINFNLSYFIHKYNIHEKQNVKVQYVNMDERVWFPLLREYLCGQIESIKLVGDMRSVRFFVAYHILYKECIRTSMSFEDIISELKTKEYDLLEDKQLYSSKGWRSETDLSHKDFINDNIFTNECGTVKEYSKSMTDLSNLKRGSRFQYNGPLDLFYFLEYILTGNPTTLTRWLINANTPFDWSILGLPPMSNFILNEIRFVKDISFIYSIILQTRSHALLSKFLVKILYRIGYNHTLHVLILSSFDQRKIEDTIYLLKRLYMEDRGKTNSILRDLVVTYRPEELRPIFLSECCVEKTSTGKFHIDRNFIECLKIYLSSLKNFTVRNLRQIMNSEYFYVLLEDLDDFYYVLKVYEEKNLLHEIIPVLHKNKNLTVDKLKYLFSNFEIEKDLFFDVVDDIIKKMYKVHKKDCRESHNVSNAPACAPMSLDKNSCSFNLSDFSTTINLVHPQYREENTCKKLDYSTSISNDKKSSISSTIDNYTNKKSGFSTTISNDNYTKKNKNDPISNASTLEEIKEISESNKKYKIKKDKKIKCCQNQIRALIDLIFIYKNQNVDVKKVYKLNPQGFVERLIEVSPNDYDVFFVKAMNIVLSLSQDETILDHLVTINKDDDYWNVAIRRNLKIRNVKISQPKQENKKVYLISDTALRESYLDLSQINESKIVLESKIDQSLIKILEDRTLLSFLRKNENTFIRSELDNRRKIPTGLSMKNSSITIPMNFSSFTLNMKIYQFDTSGIQYIVEITGNSKILRIGTLNGKLFQETIKGGITERKLVEHELTYREYMYLEISYSSKNLKISINNKLYKFEIKKVDKLVLGKGFKGVFNKILLFESSGFRNCRIVNLNGSYLYIKVLHKLERYLRYNNLKGVYLDSVDPYYFNGVMPLKFDNVL